MSTLDSYEHDMRAQFAVFDIDLGWMKTMVEPSMIAFSIVEHSCPSLDEDKFDEAVSYVSDAIECVWNTCPQDCQTLGNILPLIASDSSDVYSDPLRVWLVHRITSNPIDKAELYAKAVYTSTLLLVANTVENTLAAGLGDSKSSPKASLAPNKETSKTKGASRNNKITRKTTSKRTNKPSVEEKK